MKNRIQYILCEILANKVGRILAIDYGQKRVGLAVTDPLKIIANGLTTVHVKDIFDYLKDYFEKEEVETIVIGLAKQLNNEASESMRYIEPFVKALKKKYPDKKIEMYDERFTSKLAFQAMIDGGLKKKARQNKALIDEVSATILLQSYMESI